MAKVSGTKTHTGLIWLWWLLATCGFGILLGGVASMQNVCEREERACQPMPLGPQLGGLLTAARICSPRPPPCRPAEAPLRTRSSPEGQPATWRLSPATGSSAVRITFVLAHCQFWLMW